MTIDPKTLTAEERPIVDVEACRLNALGAIGLPQREKVFHAALANVEYLIIARRKFYGAPQEAKAACDEQEVCANCKQPVERFFDHEWKGNGSAGILPDGYTCQPAPPPAPAASELPEAVADAIDAITDAYNETDDGYGCAAALEAWARSLPAASAGLPKVREFLNRMRDYGTLTNHGQEMLHAALAELDAAQAVVVVGVTREFRMVEDAAASHGLWHLDNGRRRQFEEIADAIAAVRAQAAKAQAAAMTNAEIKELVKLSVWAATASLPNDTLARLDSLREKLLATEPAEREGGAG